MRTERELLIDCLERLNRLSAAYMLVGSMASNYWGIPRTTHDLDFVVALARPEVDSADHGCRSSKPRHRRARSCKGGASPASSKDAARVRICV